MTCTAFYKTWQMNLFWPMDPPVPEQRWLSYHYPRAWQMNPTLADVPPSFQSRDDLHTTMAKVCRWTYFGWCTPQYQSRDAWDTPTAKLLRWTYFCLCNPQYQRRDDFCIPLDKTLEDGPTLANGPPSNRAEMTCIPPHVKGLKMNLLWPLDPTDTRA